MSRNRRKAFQNCLEPGEKSSKSALKSGENLGVQKWKRKKQKSRKLEKTSISRKCMCWSNFVVLSLSLCPVNDPPRHTQMVTTGIENPSFGSKQCIHMESKHLRSHWHIMKLTNEHRRGSRSLKHFRSHWHIMKLTDEHRWGVKVLDTLRPDPT